MLSACRYPSAVATLSRRCKDRIEEAFEASVDGGRDSPLLSSRLHDFGFRGCTGVEQSERCPRIGHLYWSMKFPAIMHDIIGIGKS